MMKVIVADDLSQEFIYFGYLPSAARFFQKLLIRTSNTKSLPFSLSTFS